MNKIFLSVLSISLLAGAFSINNVNAHKSTEAIEPHILKADDSVTTTLGIQEMAKASWDIGGEMVTSNEAFDYGFYSGSLNCGSGSSFTKMLKSDASEGNFTSESGNAQIDWGGVRFVSHNNERVMVVFTAKKGMTIKALANSVSDWDVDYSFYKFASISSVGVGEGVWNAGALQKTFNKTSDASNLPDAYTLEAGNVYVMEYGFQWGDERNWQVGSEQANLRFEIVADNSTPAPVINDKVLDYTDMHYFIKKNNGSEYSNNISPFKSYGFYYRLNGSETLTPVQVINNNLSYEGADKFLIQNWSMEIDNKAAFVIKMTANEKVLFETFRTALGTEWDENITLKIYTNNKVVKEQKIEGGSVNEYSCKYVLEKDEAICWEISAFQIDNGTTRHVRMLDGGDVHTTLPQFKMTPFAESNHDHELVCVDGTDSTCTEHGHRSYYTCTVCGANFEDHDGEEPIENLTEWLSGDGQKPLAAHTLTKVNGQAPTCTADGWKDYYKCTVCNALFEDEAGTTPITNLEEWKVGAGKLNKVAHTLTKVNGQAPTCTADGWKDYYKCTVCNALFEDEAGATPITNLEEWKVGAGKISKSGHQYGAWVVTLNPTETANGTRTKTCSVCGDVVTEVIPMLSEENGYTYEVIEEATTTQEGTGKWTHSEYGEFTVTIPMTIEEETSTFGCGGAIASTSVIISSLALAGVGLLLSKKKED